MALALDRFSLLDDDARSAVMTLDVKNKSMPMSHRVRTDSSAAAFSSTVQYRSLQVGVTPETTALWSSASNDADLLSPSSGVCCYDSIRFC